MTSWEEWLRAARRVKHVRPEEDLPDALVTSSSQAHWLDPAMTGNLIYTPPWVWHRHYNDGAERVRMLLVENSPLIDALGLGERESAGEVSYAAYVNRTC